MPPQLPSLMINPADLDEIRALFQTVYDFMTNNGYTNTTVNAYGDAAGVSLSVTAGDASGSYTYSQRWNGPRIALAPTSASLAWSQTQQFTATVTNPDGSTPPDVAVEWSCTGLGSIDINGLYTAPASGTTGTKDTVTVKHTASGANASAQVSLHN